MRVTTWDDPATWDAFVNDCPDATNYHRWRWRGAIARTFGHEPFYLVATEDQRIHGVLPLFLIRSRLFGNSLVSVPFFSYGGILSSSPESAALLLGRACRLATEMQAGRVELRGGAAAERGWSSHSGKVAMDVELPATSEALWARLSSRLRNKVRHAEKHGFVVERGGADRVGALYPVFAENMRNLGTPVYPRKWFEELCACEPDHTEVLTLREGGRVVAGAFLSRFRSVLEVPWICSCAEGRRDYSSVLLYWEFLKRGIELGCRRVDLGRCTPGGGTHQFKRLWGCVERPLYWHYWSQTGSAVPKQRMESAPFRLAIGIWKRLPLAVANSVGPSIVRALP